jgi:hypothetical protein
LKSLAQFSADLRRLPRTVAIKVAAEAAPVLTGLAKQTFDASENAYGLNWEPGAKGQKVTLKKSGALFGQIRYVAIGTKLRVALGVPYAKYQVGKRPVFPTQAGRLPDSYIQALQRLAVRIAREELAR